MSIALAVPLLGETIDGATIVFAVAVVAVAFVGKRMPTQTTQMNATEAKTI